MTNAAARIFMVIPAYNEAEVIAQTLQKALSTGHEIVLVDDCSTDDTALIASQFPVHLLQHLVNLGQGAALQTGMDYVRKRGGEVLVHFDADGQHRLEDLDQMLAPVLAGEADVVLGSRFMNAEFARSVPRARSILLKGAKLIDGLLTGLWLSDVHNGYRVLGKKAIDCIQLKSNGMAHASEIKLEIKRHKLRWQEVAVQIEYSDYSRAKGQSPLNAVHILLDLISRKILP